MAVRAEPRLWFGLTGIGWGMTSGVRSRSVKALFSIDEKSNEINCDEGSTRPVR